ncbi:MAG: hypothetical protein MJZ71_01030 [Bacteroidales bacterium]|nr:hypothetical protein [Bacteroidales bacterium]
MKVKTISVIIALVISLLIAYGLYSYCVCKDNDLLLAVGGTISLFLSLASCIGLKFDYGRTTTNVSAIGGVFFLLFIVSNIIFMLVQFAVPIYVVVNGLLLSVMLLAIYKVAKAS